MTISIYNNGTYVDITSFIAFQGITFTRNDIDSSDTGRTMDGTMHRSRVAVKEKIQITTVPLTRTQVSTLHTLLMPQTIEVRITEYPMYGGTYVFTMYANNITTKSVIRKGNVDYYTLSFPLIQI